MADTNKVKFGIKEAHYSILTEDENGAITYGEVKPIKGSRAFSFSKEGGEDSKWYADDGVYYNIPGTTTGYSGDLTVAKVPDEFLIDVLGFFLDYNILRNIGNYREIMENVERSGGKVQESQR